MASNAKRQKKLRDGRAAKGWKRLWIPPAILERVKELLAELEKYKN